MKENKRLFIAQKEVDEFVNRYREVREWLNKGSKSEVTKKYYPKDLMIYCRYQTEKLGKEVNPKTLIEIKKQDKKTGDHNSEKMLDDFVSNTELTQNMRVKISAVVKSFYDGNYESLARGAGRISQVKLKDYRVPTAQEIKQMCQGQNLRDIALIQTMAVTRIREGSIIKLTWKKIWDQLFGKKGELTWDKKTPVHISLRGEELKGHGSTRYSGLEQHTFLTPEATNTLLAYKEWREQKGERITKESFLFVGTDRSEGIFKPLTADMVAHIVKNAAQKIGRDYSPHDLGRFTETQLEASGLPQNFVRKICGHKLKGEEKPYSLPKIEELREWYVKAYEKLTFEEGNNEILKKRVAEATQDIVVLRKMYDESRQEVQALKEDNKELMQNLTSQIKKLEIWNSILSLQRIIGFLEKEPKAPVVKEYKALLEEKLEQYRQLPLTEEERKIQEQLVKVKT